VGLSLWRYERGNWVWVPELRFGGEEDGMGGREGKGS
jgi:hypothetical protein